MSTLAASFKDIPDAGILSYVLGNKMNNSNLCSTVTAAVKIFRIFQIARPVLFLNGKRMFSVKNFKFR